MSSSPNGHSPLSSAYSSTPAENTSERGSTRSPRACSGDMNGMVPLMPTAGRFASRERATPKSVSFTSPSNDSNTFAGLTSQVDDAQRAVVGVGAPVRVVQTAQHARHDVQRFRRRQPLATGAAP